MAADLAVDVVVSVVSKFLLEEYAVLGNAARHVEWIEKELRSMRGLLEQVEKKGNGEQTQELKDFAEKLQDVALDAKNVIETFLIKSVKRRRRGVFHWFDKHTVGKDLEKIRKKMREISYIGLNLNKNVLVLSVENPPSSRSNSSSIPVVVYMAMEKLDHILSQNLIASNKVIELVEGAKDGLKVLENIVSNLKSSNERETVWLEEVNDVCSCTVKVAENFIARSSFQRKLPYHSWKFKKQMKCVSTEIGDALARSLIYGIVDMDETTQKPTTVPVQDLSVEDLIISELLPFSISYIADLLLLSFANDKATYIAVVFLIAVITKAFVIIVRREPITASKLNPKRGAGPIRAGKLKSKRGIISKLLTSSTFLDISILFVTFIMLYFIPFQVALLFQLIVPLCEVIFWIVRLWKSKDNNLKCVQRDLDLMHAFLSDTADRAESMNERQKVWFGQLKLVAQNGRSFLDAATDCWSSRTKFAKGINCLLKEILNISDRKTNYCIANILIQQERERSCHDDNSGAASSSSLYKPVTGLKQEVQSIRGEKELMNALLQDVRDMKELDGTSRIWVDQMKIIDSEIATVISDYDDKLNHRSILIYIFKYWTRQDIGNKINAIKNKIEDASRRRRVYGSGKTIESSSSTVHILRGTKQLSLVNIESDVVGFDDDAQVMMDQLLSDEKRRCITWIVGIGGAGKTELAKMIFQDSAVVSHFECRVWVSLTSKSNQEELFEEINKEAAKQIQGDSSNVPTVLKNLAQKRYLLVVDGIEETSQVYLLDTLEKEIPDMSTGSRLLLTARNANAAQQAVGTNNFVYPLHLLDDESSRVLFKKHLKLGTTRELTNVEREIVIKCGGLPSQIIEMSRFLSDKESDIHEEWSTELNKVQIRSWSETVNTINNHLALYLTGCLFYFGLFPAEFGIPVRRLVALLIAEERVHLEEHEDLREQVAEWYLTKLIDQNLVQIAERKPNGKVKTCRLPYGLRELWWTKANEYIFHKAHTAGDSNADPKNSIIRWVTDDPKTHHIWLNHIHGDTSSTRIDPASLRNYYKDVISFLSFDTREGSKPGREIGYFMKVSISSDCFLLLRVLDLERVYKPKLPKSIARLSQLRYLGLRWTYLESLPSFISKLLKLQTLDLKHTYIHTLPISIWEMELRHLFLSDTFHSRFPPQQKDHFSCIRFLLPHLRDNFLSDLQTLWGLFVDEETPVKDGLDTLVKITKLGLTCQQMSSEKQVMTKKLEAVADWIEKLIHLQSLRLKSRDEEGKPWKLHLKSFKNHEKVTDMYLLGTLSSSSLLSEFPRSLIELTLSHSELKDDPMKLLKDFPNLRILSLLANSYLGQTMVCESQSFPQLHILKFWVLEPLAELKIEQGALPYLRQLEIRSCPNLKMLPDGLKHVSTLLELKLTNMPSEINAEINNIPLPPNCKVVKTDFQ
ncbi:disease resistance protein RPP13-like [Vicia villosa]|uniref:disease resistance protein RPP13-like n=1 Tax=Vicia villosa TaxID=3911 RepID=UPI00273C98E3|nr:disease resistance protein RPP13-like [Vicia villosa]